MFVLYTKDFRRITRYGGNDFASLLLKSAFLCVVQFFGLSSFDAVTTLILSRLASFLPFFEVIPEIFYNFVFN